jgi:mono/diheme cytochrome c family protein
MTIRPWQQIGRRVAGVPALAIASWSWAISAGAQQTQVQRGEYLARAGDCISCHTAKVHGIAKAADISSPSVRR